MVSLLIASGLSLLSIASLYQSWRARAPAFFYASLVMLVIACVGWSLSQGWEYGLVYALCLPGLLVWLFIGANQVRLPAPKNDPAPRPVNTSFRQVCIHCGHTLVVLPGLMLVSLLATMAFSLRMPTETPGQLAVAIVLLPVVWGLLAYHYLATRAKTKALISYLVLSGVSALMLLYLPGLT